MVVQAPEHVIENLRLSEKAARDGKKVVKRKPPEHNFVNWDLNTFKRLIGAPPERLVVALPGVARDAAERAEPAGRRLPRDAAADPRLPRARGREAGASGGAPGSCSARSSLAASWSSCPRTEDGAKLRVNVDLQDDFSMDQTLSLYLLETLRCSTPSRRTTRSTC